MNIPELEDHCNSWIVTRKETGDVVFETSNRAILYMLDPEKALIKTAAQHLADLNQRGTDNE